MLNSQPISSVYLLSSVAIVVLYYPIIIQDIVTPKVNRTTKITETFTTYPLVISIALGSLGSQVILDTHSLWSLRLSIRFMVAYFRVFFCFPMFTPRSCFFRNLRRRGSFASSVRHFRQRLARKRKPFWETEKPSSGFLAAGLGNLDWVLLSGRV